MRNFVPLKFLCRNKRREIGIKSNSPLNFTDFFIVVIVAVPVWALRLITYRASSLSLSINKLYWFWRSRQMDWPLLASSLVNPICPCGGKTTKKQKCIVSSVLLPFHIGYNRHYSYYRIREFEAHWAYWYIIFPLFCRISKERRIFEKERVCGLLEFCFSKEVLERLIGLRDG